MGSRVEQFEQIRRDRDREGLSIRALAERHGVHRRAVRQALVSPLPPAKRAPVGRPAPKLGPYRAVIDEWLEADRAAPRKQRHTAKRIWRRLVDEHGADVAEVTVRQYVRRRKRQLGWPVSEVFVPQVHAPGVEAEVDWGQAVVELAGVPMTVHLFVMRASFSGAAFCQASLVETQQAFLELHVQAFEWFGGVFAEIRFDNLTSAVKKVLKGRRRIESDRFVALRSHYLFASAFTTPGLEGAHEKGGVEGEVGRSRRNHMVPVPQVADLAELNALLLAGCELDLGRRIDGRPGTVGEAWATERPLLGALPPEPFDSAEPAAPRVDQKSLVTIRQNRYSVPVALAGLKVSARVGAREITISHAGSVVAIHERLHGKFGTSAQLDHYLELLRRRPGGLERSLALAQERERGAWPGCFDELWAALTGRYGRSDAARQMVDVLLLCREHGPDQVALAVCGALAAGAHDGRAVAVLARRAQTAHSVPAPPLDLEPRLAAHARPTPDLTDYDQLLGGGTR
ncbi:MAG TPA: IS21 family transposase [Thermoleophilaceae bacterium]|nr:IS21 family transposase [Thermoleophilaceae bacterium]